MSELPVYYPIHEDGLFGFIDESGRVVIAPKFSAAMDWFGETQRLIPAPLGEKWGFIDRSGEFVVEAEFDGASSFSEGIAAVKVGGKWGAINEKGERIISPRFDDDFYFYEGLAAAIGSGGLYGYIGKDGEFAIEPRFTSALDFSCLRASVEEGELPGVHYICPDGVRAFDKWFLICSHFSEGLASVCETSTDFGFIDTQGQYVIDPRFGIAGSFSGGICPAESDESWGYINRLGEWVIEPRFRYASDFSSGLARVKDDAGLCGFVDEKGGLVIEYQFDTAGRFRGALAAVKLRGHNAYVNRDGLIVWYED